MSLSPLNVLSTLMLLMALCTAPAVFAHTHLRSATPAADSRVASVNELRLGFSEGVEASFSRVQITAADGANIAVSGIASAPGDQKILIITPSQPLPPGEYQVHWQAVSVDTHKSAGHYRFSVGQ